MLWIVYGNSFLSFMLYSQHYNKWCTALILSNEYYVGTYIMCINLKIEAKENKGSTYSLRSSVCVKEINKCNRGYNRYTSYYHDKLDIHELYVNNNFIMYVFKSLLQTRLFSCVKYLNLYNSTSMFCVLLGIFPLKRGKILQQILHGKVPV